MKKILFKNRGFTLVEIMVSMVIVSLVVAGIYAVYTIQQRTYTVQEQVTEMQQKIRSALDFMARDMRMTNYTYDNNCQASGIISATSTFFSADYCHWNEDGNSWELRQITYRLDPNTDNMVGSNNLMRNLTVNRNLPGHTARLAEGVDAIEFCYLNANPDRDPSENPLCMDNPDNDRNAIRSVRISMLVRSTFPDPRHTDTIVYRPASVPPDDTPGVDWLNPNPPNDNFHRRLLITTVKLRNMGLL
jgi:type IV pilus assembly protein PilW